MTEDGINWGLILIPAVIGMIISVVLNGMSKMSKTADNTLTGSIKINEVEKRVEGIESIVMKQGEKIENMSSKLELHSYRLDKLNHTQ